MAVSLVVAEGRRQEERTQVCDDHRASPRNDCCLYGAPGTAGWGVLDALYPCSAVSKAYQQYTFSWFSVVSRNPTRPLCRGLLIPHGGFTDGLPSRQWNCQAGRAAVGDVGAEAARACTTRVFFWPGPSGADTSCLSGCRWTSDARTRTVRCIDSRNGLVPFGERLARSTSGVLSRGFAMTQFRRRLRKHLVGSKNVLSVSCNVLSFGLLSPASKRPGLRGTTTIIFTARMGMRGCPAAIKLAARTSPTGFRDEGEASREVHRKKEGRNCRTRSSIPGGRLSGAAPGTWRRGWRATV